MTSQSANSKTKTWLSRVTKNKGAYGKVDSKEQDDETSYELGERARAVEGVRESTESRPASDPSPTRLNAFTRWRRKFSGWRMGICFSIGLSGTVLILNIALMAWAMGSYPSQQAGIVTMSNGSCSVARRWGIWLHLVINVLSTLLLGASNYAMQCISAPTRQEVDKFHSVGSTLDIGIQSVRNIFRIRTKRRFMWWLLALSSIPLHLLYNSAIFEAIEANEYYIFIVSPEFFEGAAWSEDIASRPNFIGMEWETDAADVDNRLMKFQQNVTTVDRYDSITPVIQTYGNAYLTNRGDLLMVAKPKASDGNSSLLGYTGASPSMSKYGDARSGGHTNYWLCNDLPLRATMAWTCNTDKLHASNWTLFSYKPEYFLSQETDEHCELLFSRNIMIVVIVCNAIKMLVMIAALKGATRNPLVTFGDAAASFLENPDPHTKGFCLLSKRDVDNYRNAAAFSRQKGLPGTGFDPPLMTAVLNQSVTHSSAPQHYLDLKVDNVTTFAALPYKKRRYRWFSAASGARWSCTLALCLLTLILVAVLLGIGIGSLRGVGLSTNLHALWALGFGTLNANALVSLSQTFFPATPGYTSAFILLANTPQIIFSFLYLLYNALYTCMAQAAEWSSFAHERKGFRVTQPRGAQRSTYYLHLPYRYGLPLMAGSVLMHWLISQSLFLARVQRRTITPGGETDMRHNSSVTCGYSIMPVIFSIALGCAMLLVLLVLALVRRLPGDMPLIGSNSAVISAACHSADSDEGAASMPLMWGVTAEAEEDGIGHCAFSSGAVQIPIEGRLYAGIQINAAEITAG